MVEPATAAADAADMNDVVNDKGRPAHQSDLTPSKVRRIAPRCRHCNGTAHEPPPMPVVEFSRSGEHRGKLKQLADETGMDKSAISEILRGLRTPSAAAIVLLANAFGVSESRLIHYPPIWHRLCSEMNDGEEQ